MQTSAGKYSYNYDVADEMLIQNTPTGSISYGYDANGSQILQQAGTVRTTYQWDPRNRLSSVTLPTGGRYTQLYRPDDMRLSESGPVGPTTMVWSNNDVLGMVGTQSGSPMQQVFAHSSEGSASGGAASSPLLARNERSGEGKGEVGCLVRALGAHADSSAINRAYHLDNQGGVLALTTATGSIEADYHTDSWGNVISGTAADNPYVYLGGLGYWEDTSLSLNYVRARWQETSTGSWQSVDSVRTEPRYQYAHNSPTRLVDASGRDSFLSDIGNAIGGAAHRVVSGIERGTATMENTLVRSANKLGDDIRGDVDAFGNFLMNQASPDVVLAGMDQLMHGPLGMFILSNPDTAVVAVATHYAVRLWKRSLRLYYKILPLVPQAIANSLPHSQSDVWAWEFDFILYALLGFVQQSFQQIPGINQVVMLQQFVDDYQYFAQVGLTFDTIFDRFIEDPLIQVFKELITTRDVTAALLGSVIGAIVATFVWELIIEVIDAVAAPETLGASEAEGVIEAASDLGEVESIVARLRKHSKGWLIEGIEKHPQVVDAIKRMHTLVTKGKIGQVRSIVKSAPGRLLAELRKLVGAAPPKKLAKSAVIAMLPYTTRELERLSEDFVIGKLKKEGYTKIYQIKNNSKHGIDVAVLDEVRNELLFVEIKATQTPRIPALSVPQGSAVEFVNSRLALAAAGQGVWSHTPPGVMRDALELQHRIAGTGGIPKARVKYAEADLYYLGPGATYESPTANAVPAPYGIIILPWK